MMTPSINVYNDKRTDLKSPEILLIIDIMTLSLTLIHQSVLYVYPERAPLKSYCFCFSLNLVCSLVKIFFGELRCTLLFLNADPMKTDW